MNRIAAFTLFISPLLIIPVSASGADSRSEEFCNLATRHFAAFVAASPEKQVRSGRCVLGSSEKGEVDVYFPPGEIGEVVPTYLQLARY